LTRAWKQANRVDILVKNRKAPLKRVAIATRWGSADGGAAAPILSVRDPQEEGDMSRSEKEATLIGVARLHAANLLKALGHVQLASTLGQLALAGEDALNDATSTAQAAFDDSRLHHLADHHPIAPPDALLGNWVTRAGPIDRPDLLSAADQEALRRLELRPVFVGLERRFVTALIAGNLVEMRTVTSGGRQATGAIRMDGVGSWTIHVGDGVVLE
jgi:hypothetical protein